MTSRTGRMIAMARWPPCFFLSILVVAWLPAAGQAQQTIGRVLAADGRPLEAVLVRLLDTNGDIAASALSRADGGFTIRAPAAGRYTVRAEYIGYATTDSELLSLKPRQSVRLELRMQPAAVLLTRIEVTGQARCDVRPGTGLATALLWQEARKTLDAVIAGVDAADLRYIAVTTDIERDLTGRRRGRTVTDSVPIVGALPFRTLDPAILHEHGYIHPNGHGGHDYYAPDAAVLLSDEFLDTHCFRIGDPDPNRPGLIGLAFERVGPRPGIADIEGVLWLDRETAELRSVDFTYDQLPFAFRGDPFGGSIEFDRLPGGLPYIAAWTVRIPNMQRRPTLPGREGPLELAGVRERTGRAVDASARRLAVGGAASNPDPPIPRRGAAATSPRGEIARRTTSRILGRVSDAESGEPITAALIRIEGTDITALTDSSGVYVVPRVPPGATAISIEHVAYATARGSVEVGEGEDVRVDARLETTAIPLDPIEVVARARFAPGLLSGFAERREWGEKLGLGYFTTAEEMGLTTIVSLIDAIRRLPGVRVATVGGNRRHLVIGRGRGSCLPVVYVDGIRVQRAAEGGPSFQTPTLDELVPFVDVAAVEVYRGLASAPPEFGGIEARCGVIALWTKRS